MKYFLSFLSLALLVLSCGKDTPATVDPAAQLSLELSEIKRYLSTNNLTAQETATGLHYIVEDQGRGDFIDDNAFVNVLLTGYFLDGTQFDATGDCTPITSKVSELLAGIREGLSLFNVGGKGTLILPSAIAFGQTGSGPIPANTTILFDLEIVDIEPFEKGKIHQYIVDKNLTVDSTASGIFYVIDEPGEGEHPTPSSTVQVNYKGYYLNGTVFDESRTPTTFNLKDVILGWQEAIPLLKPGGKGTFIIPSGRAYGSSTTAGIPGNSILVFEVELLKIQ